jgi:glycine C-acetyltransferase
LKALDLISESTMLRDRLRANTEHFRARMTDLEFDILPGEHPIVPVMIGDEIIARDFSQALLARGVLAVNFSFPVVPRGAARIRTQMSAAHTSDDIDFAVTQFEAVREELAG